MHLAGAEVPGGLLAHVQLAVRGLALRGHSLHAVLSPVAGADGAAAVCAAGRAAVTRLAVGGKSDIVGQARLRSLVAHDRPDILHVHLSSPVEAIPAILAARAGGAAHIVTTEHAPSWAPLAKAWSRPAKKLSGLLLDAVIAVCESDALLLEREYGVPPERMRVIRNGVDPFERLPARAAARAAFGLPGDGFVVGAVGALEEKKGILDLLEAARLAAPAIPGLTVLLAGEGSLAARLRNETVGALGFRLVLAGQRDDVATVYAALDAFVLPSHQEALPLALLEAMQAGCPVLATRVGGIPEAVDDERAGLLVEPGRPDRLAEGLRRLASDPPLRQRLGAAAQAAARQRFSTSRMVTDLETLYGEILGRAAR